MLIGHMKVSPDWCFGLMKQHFRVSKVDCLDDLVKVVQTSATVNEAQFVGSQTGEPIIPMYDWAEFLGSRIKKISLITSYHHFEFYITGKSYHQGIQRLNL